MPRKNRPEKRDVLPDPIYNSKLVSKLINKLMYSGKKGTSQTIIYTAFKLVEKKTGRSGIEVFDEALNNIMPSLVLKLRRVGGSNLQVPVEITQEGRISLGLRWIVQYARERKGEKTMQEKLAGEIIDAANNTGASVKKKEDTHRMAEANKAFAHFKF
jgi:small subunit ribosomal protein S7